MEDVWPELLARVRPGPALDAVTDGWSVWATLGVAAALVLLPGVWRLVRVGVTVVHELGHAAVGMAAGRRFTGLVLRLDMSGHTVTVGPARGAGRVATTWAGYPAPGVVGAGLLHAATAGWAAPVLGAVLLVLVAAALRVRSGFTALVVVAVLGGTAALWWAGPPSVQGLILVGAGAVLVAGAWRHLGAVLGRRERGSDPAVLARLTRVPAAVWSASFAVVLGAATWWGWQALRPLVGT